MQIDLTIWWISRVGGWSKIDLVYEFTKWSNENEIWQWLQVLIRTWVLDIKLDSNVGTYNMGTTMDSKSQSLNTYRLWNIVLHIANL
jgi:hypothetical protein